MIPLAHGRDPQFECDRGGGFTYRMVVPLGGAAGTQRHVQIRFESARGHAAATPNSSR
jgi:hypothetical protein